MGPATYYASARLKLPIGGSSPHLFPRATSRDSQPLDLRAEADALMEALVRLWSRFVSYRRILEPSTKVLVGYLPESMFLDARPSGGYSDSGIWERATRQQGGVIARIERASKRDRFDEELEEQLGRRQARKVRSHHNY